MTPARNRYAKRGKNKRPDKAPPIPRVDTGHTMLALFRVGTYRCRLAAAFVAVVAGLISQTAGQAFAQARQNVLYLDAPAVSAERASRAGEVADAYAQPGSGTSPEALAWLDVPVRSANVSTPAADTEAAFASITAPDTEEVAVVTPNAAVRAGEAMLAQIERSPQGAPGVGEDSDLASSAPVRPELGDGTHAPVPAPEGTGQPDPGSYEDIPDEAEYASTPASASPEAAPSGGAGLVIPAPADDGRETEHAAPIELAAAPSRDGAPDPAAESIEEPYGPTGPISTTAQTSEEQEPSSADVLGDASEDSGDGGGESAPQAQPSSDEEELAQVEPSDTGTGPAEADPVPAPAPASQPSEAATGPTSSRGQEVTLVPVTAPEDGEGTSKESSSERPKANPAPAPAPTAEGYGSHEEGGSKDIALTAPPAPGGAPEPAAAAPTEDPDGPQPEIGNEKPPQETYPEDPPLAAPPTEDEAEEQSIIGYPGPEGPGTGEPVPETPPEGTPLPENDGAPVDEQGLEDEDPAPPSTAEGPSPDAPGETVGQPEAPRPSNGPPEIPHKSPDAPPAEPRSEETRTQSGDPRPAGDPAATPPASPDIDNPDTGDKPVEDHGTTHGPTRPESGAEHPDAGRDRHADPVDPMERIESVKESDGGGDAVRYKAKQRTAGAAVREDGTAQASQDTHEVSGGSVLEPATSEPITPPEAMPGATTEPRPQAKPGDRTGPPATSPTAAGGSGETGLLTPQNSADPAGLAFGTVSRRPGPIAWEKRGSQQGTSVIATDDAEDDSSDGPVGSSPQYLIGAVDPTASDPADTATARAGGSPNADTQSQLPSATTPPQRRQTEAATEQAQPAYRPQPHRRPAYQEPVKQVAPQRLPAAEQVPHQQLLPARQIRAEPLAPAPQVRQPADGQQVEQPVAEPQAQRTAQSVKGISG